MKLKISTLLASMLLASCANLHNGNFASPEGSDSSRKSTSGIVISGIENDDLSSEYFGEIDFTFENTTADWVRIKNITIDFDDPTINKAVRVPVGSDLISWAKAAEQDKQIRDYNTSLVLGSVMTVGAFAAGASHNPGVRGLGADALIGSAGGLTLMGLREERENAELAKLVPPSHLMSDDFVIPPGLHTKKWLALYTKDPHSIPFISTVTISYSLENGKTERAKLKFRSAYSSKWQDHTF